MDILLFLHLIVVGIYVSIGADYLKKDDPKPVQTESEPYEIHNEPGNPAK